MLEATNQRYWCEDAPCRVEHGRIHFPCPKSIPPATRSSSCWARIMVLAMHAGFAFLELGTVRKKNQVNALVKILVDFAVSTVAYFFVGYAVAYGVGFLRRRRAAGRPQRLRTGEVLLPADLRGGDPGHRLRRHRRARALRSAAGRHGGASSGWSIRCSKASSGTSASACRRWIKAPTGADFHDFAGSVVVHAVGGWIGARRRCCCSARAATATARTARSARTRRRASRSSRSAPGCSPSAGSAST